MLIITIIVINMFLFSGKCFGDRGQIHETHKVLFQSISVLVSRNPFGHTDSSVPPTFLLDFIGKEISGDAFTVERAAILFNISWFYLKSYHSKDTRYLEQWVLVCLLCILFISVQFFICVPYFPYFL